MPDTLLRNLVDDLASPAPAVRDERGCAGLARLVGSGDLRADDRAWLAAAMLERLHHDRIEARAFAPLVLAALVRAGDFDQAWLPAVFSWYVGEEDLRGYDPGLGWLHAVAHGAELLRRLRRHRSGRPPGPSGRPRPSPRRADHLRLAGPGGRPPRTRPCPHPQPPRRRRAHRVQHSDLVRQQIAVVLHEVTPWSWRPHPRQT